MADMMDTLKGLLGDNADGKIQNAMNMLKNSGLIDNQQNKNLEQVAEGINKDIKTDNGSGMGGLSPEGIEFINQIKGVVNRISNTNDTRSDLLRSLRPFMRTERQHTIDRAIRLLNIGRFAGIFAKK